jgi:uncharacterized protein
MVDATNRCQLDCRYCYFGKKGSDVMDVEKVTEAITRFLATIKNLKKFDLHYMGGEPLLAWSEILELNEAMKELAQKRQIKFRWSMTSNLIALDEARTSHMISEGASIHCSIDGPAHVHDRNRPFPDGRGSYEQVVSRIPLALRINPNDTARVTVCPEDADKLPEIAATVLGHGFKSVGIFPNYDMPWNEEAITNWSEGIAQAFESFKQDGKSRISTMVKPEHACDGCTKKFSYCGAGKSLWAFNVHGLLYHCHHFTNISELAIIDASSATGDQITQAIMASDTPPFGKEMPEQCTNCPAVKSCNGLCWASNFLGSGNAVQPESTQCQLQQATYAALQPILREEQLTMQACPRGCEACDIRCYGCIVGECGECEGKCDLFECVNCVRSDF